MPPCCILLSDNSIITGDWGIHCHLIVFILLSFFNFSWSFLRSCPTCSAFDPRPPDEEGVHLRKRLKTDISFEERAQFDLRDVLEPLYLVRLSPAPSTHLLRVKPHAASRCARAAC